MVQRWLVKLEEEDSVRGLAYFDVGSITGLESTLRETFVELGQSKKASRGAKSIGPTWLRAGVKLTMSAPLEEVRNTAQVHICGLLLQDLRKALTIVAPRAYPDYRAYVQVRPPASCMLCMRAEALRAHPPTTHESWWRSANSGAARQAGTSAD